MKKETKLIHLRRLAVAFSLFLLAICSSFGQTSVITFPVARLTVGEALKTLELQGKKTVAANLSYLTLDQEIELKRTQGSLEEMTNAVMEQIGLGYRITETNIIILPPVAKEETPKPLFKTPGIPNYKRNDDDGKVSLSGDYQVLSVSLVSREKEPVDYPSSSVSHFAPSQEVDMSGIALKTNFLYGATLTPNLGVEFSIGKKSTIDISAGYNFFEPGSGKRWKHWLVQPEYRWWFCERFNGAFIGGHLLGGQFNFAEIDFPFNVFSDLKDNRYEGEYYGGGVVFGYQWILAKRWSLELAVGAGYVRVDYDKYKCNTCGPATESGHKNYFGPTKAAVSLLFFL